MNELVSVIMPSYNTSGFIRETIESVLNQTYQNFEIIIVDDCSTDSTDDVVAQINDERIKFIKNEKNSGAAVSRNRALIEAKGKWIAFLDSDDIWHPEKLEKQISFMEKNRYAFTYTEYEEIDEASLPLGTYVTGPKKITKTGMYNYCWPGCLTVMYNRDIVGEIQIEDIKKNNDYAIWLKAVKKAPCYLLKENLARYRIRSNSISRHNKVKLIKHHYILYRGGENRNCVSSCILTVRNLFFGILKKMFYVKKLF